jgi:MFS family permease
MFAAFGYRNYRLFFVGQFISTMGMWIQQPVMGLLVWQMTGSMYMLGVLGAVSALPMTLLSPLGGLAAERFQKRRVLLVTQPLLFLPPVALAVLMLANYPIQLWHLFAVAIASGTLMAFDVPSRQAFVMDLVDRPDVPNAIALNSLLFNLSRAVGPLIAAPIFAISPALCFAANGVSYLALVAALLLMSVGALYNVRGKGRTMYHPWGGIIYAWTQREIRGAMVILAAATIFGWSVQTQLPAFADKVFGRRDAWAYWWFMVVFGLGALTGALGMAYLSRYRNRRRLVLGGLGVFVASATAFTLTVNFHLALGPMFGMGLGLMACMAGVNSYIQMEVSRRFHGRIMGVYAMFFGGMMPAGAFALGWLAERVGLQTAVQINMALLAGVTVWAAMRWKKKLKMQN